MDEEVARIELVHTSWIDSERAGVLNRLLTLCAEDIEFHPPNGSPIVGREEVGKYLSRVKAVIHNIEVSDRRVRISDGFAYLTAKYQTTFTAQDGPVITIVGSRLDSSEARQQLDGNSSGVVDLGLSTRLLITGVTPPYHKRFA